MLLISCVGERKAMNSFLGSHQRDLIRQWGPPVRTASDGDDGQILVYSTSAYNAYLRITTYRYRMFYVNREKIIYHWITQGGQVPPQQLDIDLYIR